MGLRFSLKKQKAETSSSFLPIGDTPVQVFYNSHFVSEVRNFRHCDRVNNVTCQVLYPLGNDNTNVVNIYEISNIKFTIDTYTAGFQRVCSLYSVELLIKQKAKLSAWLNAERRHPDLKIRKRDVMKNKDRNMLNSSFITNNL